MSKNADSFLNAWGLSWSCSWGNSWGSCGAGVANKQKRTQGFPNEMEILKRSLERTKHKNKESIEPKEQLKETFDGTELIQESKEIRAKIDGLHEKFNRGIIEQKAYQRALTQQNEALKIVEMALELDKFVLYVMM